MEITGQNVKELQVELKSILKKGLPDNSIITVGKKQNIAYYQIIHQKNDVTQGLGVVPVDNAKGDNPHYDQATIVIAGTQMVWDGSNSELSEKVSSTKNAIEARKSLTAQAKEIDAFYDDTLRKIKENDPNGNIRILSGHSQAGPGVAKTGINKKVEIIYNFQPWASYSAVQNNDFTKKDLDYLNEHAIVYSDLGKMITFIDKNKGKIAYGKVFVVDENSHDAEIFDIKGNGLDIASYVKKGKFCSGMTEAQVRQVAKKKAANSWWNWDDKAEIKKMVSEYEKLYGPFASTDELDSIRSKNNTTRKKLKGATGDKKISLRKDIVLNAAKLSKMQAADYLQDVEKEMIRSKEAVQQYVDEFVTQVNFQGAILPSYEISSFLSELTMSIVWNEAIEANTLSAAKSFQEKLDSFSTSLENVAKNIVETDQSGVLLFK